MLDGTVSVRQAASLAACLPLGSASLGADDDLLGWSMTDLLLLRIANMLCQPQDRIDPFKERDVDVMLMSVDEFDEYLARAREQGA